jgi:hypothetical protein
LLQGHLVPAQLVRRSKATEFGISAGNLRGGLDAIRSFAVEVEMLGDGVERDRVLDLLGSLIDQSLVIAEKRERGMRYRLLETVREYGFERLAEAGEEEALRGHERDFFVALAEEAALHFETGRQREWFELLDPEAANLAAAIDWALRSEPRLALRFCAALSRWWCARGRLAEAELAFALAGRLWRPRARAAGTRVSRTRSGCHQRRRSWSRGVACDGGARACRGGRRPRERGATRSWASALPPLAVSGECLGVRGGAAWAPANPGPLSLLVGESG